MFLIITGLSFIIFSILIFASIDYFLKNESDLDDLRYIARIKKKYQNLHPKYLEIYEYLTSKQMNLI